MSSTLTGLASSIRSRAQINSEEGTVSGAMDCANATQNSSLGFVLSPADQTDPPLRTACVSESKFLRASSVPNNPAIEARHAGDLRSKKIADSWVSAYL